MEMAELLLNQRGLRVRHQHNSKHPLGQQGFLHLHKEELLHLMHPRCRTTLVLQARYKVIRMHQVWAFQIRGHNRIRGRTTIRLLHSKGLDKELTR